MKKILLTTALLTASAGMAAAEVTFSGYGRFGIAYDEGATDNETTIALRLRFNINASVETDSGVTFGGRVRLQYTDGQDSAQLSAAYLFASYEGMRLEVGNANTAYDSAALMYDSEQGYLDRSFGNPGANFYSFNSGPNPTDDYMAIFFGYSVGDFNGRISYVTEDQTGATDVSEELSVSADYKFGAITVSGAYAQNAGGTEDQDLFFLGAAYAINDVANVGILYFDDGEVAGEDQGQRVTLYGNYKFDAITVEAYIANDSYEFFEEETVYGIGADYDLGGARLSGSVQSGYDGDIIADLGVRFDF